MKNNQKNYYKEIDNVLQTYENYKPYHTKDIDWVCNRIDWCWKWRKITKEQMEELANRAVEILKNI
jgi:hypothetical protein